MWAFSSCGKGWLLLLRGTDSRAHRIQEPCHTGLRAQAQQLRRTGFRCFSAREISPDQGWDPSVPCTGRRSLSPRATREVLPHFSVGDLTRFLLLITTGLPTWCSGKESACQRRRRKRLSFNPWIRKIPWSRKWQPTPVFLPGKFHGQRSLDSSP